MLVQMKIFTGPEICFNYSSLQAPKKEAVEESDRLEFDPADAPTTAKDDLTVMDDDRCGETAPSIFSTLHDRLNDVASVFQTDVFQSMWLGSSKVGEESLVEAGIKV